MIRASRAQHEFTVGVCATVGRVSCCSNGAYPENDGARFDRGSDAAAGASQHQEVALLAGSKIGLVELSHLDNTFASGTCCILPIIRSEKAPAF